ncbi:hypothetical protein [Rhodococcus qingshengii]|uniref:hypothetical protein n=1 Tax=Rhodococcus qingshengii TaxID=334542 RepID=UPI001C5DCE45|nr:hypothetical protein [Rhodococcus qingshengii]MBW4813134.1 hypothetical protein [Rhodococcus qingshengii]
MAINFDEYLEAQLGRRVSREEIALAAGISVATYGRRKSDQFPADEVIAVSRHFNLSPAKVLLDLDYLTLEEILAAAGSDGATVAESTDLELAEALVERLRESDPAIDNVRALTFKDQPQEIDILDLPYVAHEPAEGLDEDDDESKYDI